MLTYGFYNSVNKDRRYDAEQISALFDGLINDGIYANYKEAMKIVPGSGKRQIVIRPGRAWFNGTWTLIDDGGHPFHIMHSEVETTYYIYLCVDKATRRNSIAWYSEVQESKPGDGVFFYLMGQITIPAGIDTITEDMIVDLRGSSHCPFVTGILETADFERIVRETCEENWLLWLNSYEKGLDAKVEQIQAIANKASTSADLAIATVQNLRHLAYRWAKYHATLVQGGSLGWVLAVDIPDSGGEPPRRILYREFTFDGVNCTLSDPVSTTGMTAADQYVNYRSAPYFYGDGYGGTAAGNVYRYERMTENVKASGNSVTITYGYRVSCAKIVEGVYKPGAYIETVEAQYPSEYPLDGYKDGYWYTRFASRASDVFFDNTGLTMSARTVQEAIEALYKTGGSGNGTDVLGYYSATMNGAKGDGVADDSPALNALVKKVHDAGGGTIWLPKGTYMLDSPIIWASNVSLRGEGIGLSVLKPRQAEGVGEGFAAIRGRKTTHFTADAPCENATFEQFSIDGSEMYITNYTSWPKGINIHYMRNCVFQDLVISNTKATGLGIDMLENVTIDGIFLYNCGAGASVDSAEINEGGAGIGIGTWGMPQESFIIRNCVADGCGRYGIFLERQIGASDDTVANYIVSNNIVKNGRKHGIVVKGGSRVNVVGNTCYNNAQYGMAVLENNGFLTDAVKFSGNLSYNNGVGFAVDTEEAAAEDIFCTENVISGCDTGVLILSDVDGLTIARNTIKRCTNPVVVEGDSQHDFVYKDNVLLGNGSQPRTTATFTGCTDYIDQLVTGHPTRVEIPASKLLLGVKIMPDGSETADAVAQSTGFINVQGMGDAVKITTMAETWNSKDSARVAQYDVDKVCLQESAPTYSVANDNPNELTVELIEGCAYIRIFYGAGTDKTQPAALTSVVVESAY